MMKIYIGKKVILQGEMFDFVLLFYALADAIYIKPRTAFFSSFSSFFLHQGSVVQQRQSLYFIVFPDRIDFIWALFCGLLERKFFCFSGFCYFLQGGYVNKGENHDTLLLIPFEENLISFLWLRREELSIGKYLILWWFRLQFLFSYVVEPFDFTIKKVGFFANWLNMNIKFIPFLFLLSLIQIPFFTLVKPLSIFLPFTGVTFSLFFSFILVIYLVKVYGSLLLRVFLSLVQALYISNLWQSYLYAWKLPFLISLNFLCLVIFIKGFVFLSLPFILVLFIFANLRYLVFVLLFGSLKSFFFPFTRSISNFFQKKIDANAYDELSDSFLKTFFGKGLYEISYYEDAFKDNFFYILFYYWVILVPLSLIKFVKPYFFRFVEVLKPYW